MGENFRRLFPGVIYIDPVQEQAKAIYTYLGENGLLNTQEKGRLRVYTSGATQSFSEVITRLGISLPSDLESIGI